MYADRDTKSIMRVTMTTVDIPADYPIHEVNITRDHRTNMVISRIRTAVPLPAEFKRGKGCNEERCRL